jgi:hypothetical protein
VEFERTVLFNRAVAFAIERREKDQWQRSGELSSVLEPVRQQCCRLHDPAVTLMYGSVRETVLAVEKEQKNNARDPLSVIRIIFAFKPCG